MPQQFETLARVPMFRSLKGPEVEGLNKRCTWRRVSSKEWVIDYQDQGIDVFFVVTGSVRVLIYSKSGREVILADIEQGGFFGELAPLDGQSRSAGGRVDHSGRSRWLGSVARRQPQRPRLGSVAGP